MSNTDADPVARMHALFSDARRTEFGLMESLRAKYKKTSRDIVLADAIDALLATAVQREDLNAPPSFDNRARGSGLAIVGPTGVGKSRALERYFDKHPVLSDYRDPVSPSPLISVSAPSPCTSMTLARLILRTSGYPIERDLPAHRLWEMVWERLANLRKFILHIDELQHAVQYVPEKDRQEIANILKHAMYGRRISLIVSGVDALRAFLDFDPQLLRRLTVLPFGPITPDILDRKLQNVGKLESRTGFASLLVDIEEVRSAVKLKAPDGLPPNTVARTILKTNVAVMAQLVKCGAIRTVTTINPVNRCTMAIVQFAEIERFQKQFVSLHHVARSLGLHMTVAKKRLTDGGIKPAPGFEGVNATFYKRAELAAIGFK